MTPLLSITSKNASNSEQRARLDNDVLEVVFTYLTSTDLSCCERVCRAMQKSIVHYANGYANLWREPLRPITNIATLSPKLAIAAQELAAVIMNTSILNRSIVSRVIAGIPPILKKEMAGRLFDQVPASLQKAKALAFLGAFDQTGKVVNALQEKSGSTHFLQAIAQIMAYIGRDAEELLAIVNQIQSEDYRNATLENLINIMATRGAQPEELLEIASGVANNTRRQYGLRSAAKAMVARGAKLEELFAITDRLQHEEHRVTVWDVAREMSEKNANLQELFEIAGRMQNKEQCNRIFRSAAKAMVVRNAKPEELLAFIAGKIGDDKERDSALCDVIGELFDRGTPAEELLEIANEVHGERARERAFCDVAKAMAAKGAPLEALRLLIENRIPDQERRDRAFGNIVGAMATKGMQLDLLPVIAQEIKNKATRNSTLGNIAEATATSGAGPETLLTIINAIEEEDSWDRAIISRRTIQKMLERNASPEELFMIANQTLPPRRNQAFGDVATAMALRGASLQELLEFIATNMHNEAWRTITLENIVYAMAGRGVNSSRLLEIAIGIDENSSRILAFREVAKAMVAEGACSGTLREFITTYFQEQRPRDAALRITACAMAKKKADRTELLAIINEIQNKQERDLTIHEVTWAMISTGLYDKEDLLSIATV
ncbi:MAG: hypothetical protein KGI80_03110 [Verrucomicrobiota bacterium]|nr:hypothetical protein [Verrucomicrobiota bacterium]